MQMICFGVRILIEMQYDAGYPLTETNDIGYGVLHECGIRCGAVHREVNDMPAGAPRLPSDWNSGGGLLGIFSSQIPSRYRKDILP